MQRASPKINDSLFYNDFWILRIFKDFIHTRNSLSKILTDKFVKLVEFSMGKNVCVRAYEVKPTGLQQSRQL